MEIKDINGNVIYQSKKETIKEAIEEAIMHNISLKGADLYEADLRNADLRGADLRWVDLGRADLRCTDFRGANVGVTNISFASLSGANLTGVKLNFLDFNIIDLHNAITDNRYIQVSCIGSRKDLTTYCFEEDKIWCGCFIGTLNDFEKECKITHKNNPQYLNEYLGFIEYVKCLRDNVYYLPRVEIIATRIK